MSDTIEGLRAELAQARKALAYEQAEHHHEVLCIVLKKFMHNMTHYVQKPEPGYRESMVNTARAIADLAYPPPKAEEP